MKDILSRLPTDISSLVVTLWLSLNDNALKDLVHLDSAYCSRSGRPSLLNCIFASPLFVLSHEFEYQRLSPWQDKLFPSLSLQDKFSPWVLCRGIRASAVVMTRKMDVDDWEAYLKKFGAHIKQIKIIEPVECFDYMNFLPLLLYCPLLNTLILDCCALDGRMLCVLRKCSALQELHMNGCRQSDFIDCLSDSDEGGSLLHLTTITLGCSCDLAVALLQNCDPAYLKCIDVNHNYCECVGLIRPLMDILLTMSSLFARGAYVHFSNVSVNNEEFEIMNRMFDALL